MSPALSKTVTRFIGIDPGKNGALAMLGDGKVLRIFDCPIIELGKKKWAYDLHGIANIMRKIRGHWGRNLYVFMEEAMVMPKQGTVSAFKFGKGAMAWEMAVVCAGFRYELVAPREWKPAMLKGIPGDKKDKGRSIVAAKRMFPEAAGMIGNRKKDHDRAEALLIAEWGRRKMQSEL